jgi:hypothetical protein
LVQRDGTTGSRGWTFVSDLMRTRKVTPMKSIGLTATRTVGSLAALLIVVNAAAVFGQGRGLTITVQRNGQPLSPAAVVFHAASGVKSGTLASGTATFAADVITASLEGKPVSVIVDEDEDGGVSVFLVQDDAGVQAPPMAAQTRRRRVGGFVLRPGAAIVIDIGRGTVTDSSETVTSATAGARGFGIGLFGNASGAWGGFNLGSTEGRIDDRFSAGTPPYQRRDIAVEDSTAGFAFGGGVNLTFGASVGARVGIMRENERDVPRESVYGERVEGGLRFQQQGTSLVRSWTVYAGPTLNLPWGIVVSGGPSFTFWDVELTQTGQLQVACPTPCVVVLQDNNSEQSSGSDLGFQVAADYYPGNGWFGVQVLYLLTTFRGAYDPSRPLAYPRDWRDSNFFVGAVVRMPPGR